MSVKSAGRSSERAPRKTRSRTRREQPREVFAPYDIDNNSHARLRSLRADGWKLVKDYLNAGRDELYDLRSDPEEARNRVADTAAEAREARRSLEQRSLELMRTIDDPLRLAAQ